MYTDYSFFKSSVILKTCINNVKLNSVDFILYIKLQRTHTHKINKIICKIEILKITNCYGYSTKSDHF